MPKLKKTFPTQSCFSDDDEVWEKPHPKTAKCATRQIALRSFSNIRLLGIMPTTKEPKQAMGWRFRKSFKIIPGVRLNLSRSGLSASVGGAPITLNVGPRGLFGTASLPGTGISYRQKFGDATEPVAHSSTPPLDVVPPPSIPDSLPPVVPTPSEPWWARRYLPVQEIRSASTELLTSENLQSFKQLIQTTYEEHEDISSQLRMARLGEAKASVRYLSWENGFVFKKLFKKSFAKRKLDSETERAKVQELEEQLKLTTIAAQLDMSKEQAETYFRMRDEFAALSECAAIWDKKSRRGTDKFHERTIAYERIERERVTFSLGTCDLFNWEQKIPHLGNANGGDIFLYPGFLLYRAAKHAFSVIDFHDVTVTSNLVPFVEEQGVPSDSKTIGQTWAKANKDGSRDRRFVNNYQIPIAVYRDLVLKSSSGLWEEFQFSNPERVERFAKAWNGFVASFAPQSTS